MSFLRLESYIVTGFHNFVYASLLDRRLNGAVALRTPLSSVARSARDLPRYVVGTRCGSLAHNPS